MIRYPLFILLVVAVFTGCTTIEKKIADISNTSITDYSDTTTTEI